MPPTKVDATKRKQRHSRKMQLRHARLSKASKSLESVEPDENRTPSSASKRKLCELQEPITVPENVSGNCGNSYVLVDILQLNLLVTALLCPICKAASLTLDYNSQEHMGMAGHISVRCKNCEEAITTVESSKKLSSSSSRAYDVNRRTSLAILNNGLGHAGLSAFCEVLGMKTIGQSSFCDHANRVIAAADDMKRRMVSKVAAIIHDVYQSSNLGQPDEDGILSITVSYDGSWHKRGHTSKHGIGCVIDSVTGLVVDYEALSVYCQSCETTGQKMKETDPAAFEQWEKDHKNVCLANHSGSSGAMEVQAARILWGRSLEHKLRYATMIADGDCKTHMELQRLQPYGSSHPVEKEECTNHFAKRLGTALRKVVTTEKSKGVTLGGTKQGSLTQNKITTFQSYFKKAILDNPGSVEGMRKAIWAIYYHAISTDASPQHHNCPVGADSWCKYNKAVAQSLPPPPLKSSVQLSEKVAAYIKPTFERLTSDELLGRCLLGKTQNANESVHAVIWGYCPKTTFVGANRIRLGLSLGVGQFNFGSRALHMLMEEAGLAINDITIAAGEIRDVERVKRAEKAASDAEKRRREVRRQAHLRAQAQIEATEDGPAYSAGAF